MQRFVLPLALLTLAVVPCRAMVSTNVPLDHWSYAAVEKLAGYGLIDSAMLTIRPISRVEMARHVAQAMYARQDMEDAPAILGNILERLQHEFKGELILIGAAEGWYGHSFAKPVEDPYVRFVYADEPTGLENQRGDSYGAGSNVRLGFGARAKFMERVAFYAHPEFSASSESDGDVDLVYGYGKVMIGPIEVQAGKDSLWWGPGRHGSIVMTNNVEPFTMVQITNPQPIQLPWILGWLGPFRGQWFLTELEEDRHVPEAKLSGVRLSAKPHPAVEIGLSRAVMFGGQGMPSVDLIDYIELFLATSNQETDNQIGGFDASVLVPLAYVPFGEALPLRSVKLYVEGAGEDEAGGIPSNWGYLYGLQLNDILKTGRTDLRIEYADNHVSGKPNVFYNHSIYMSGYTYKDRVIGHHMGTDSRDFFVHVSHCLNANTILDLGFDRQRHNLSDAVRPTRDIYEGALTFFPSTGWQVWTAYRYEEMGLDGGDENHVLRLGIVRRF